MVLRVISLSEDIIATPPITIKEPIQDSLRKCSDTLPMSFYLDSEKKNVQESPDAGAIALRL
jgi:hypothetical protein